MHPLVFSFSGRKLSFTTDRLPATLFFNITNANAQIEHATPSGTGGRDARAGHEVRTRELHRRAGDSFNGQEIHCKCSSKFFSVEDEHSSFMHCT